MNRRFLTDRDVVSVLEQSAVVRRFEKIAGVLRAALDSSWLRATADRLRASIAPRLGIVLMTAVISHVVLAGVARPRGVYWLMLPALFAVIAVLLHATASSRPRD